MLRQALTRSWCSGRGSAGLPLVAVCTGRSCANTTRSPEIRSSVNPNTCASAASGHAAGRTGASSPPTPVLPLRIHAAGGTVASSPPTPVLPLRIVEIPIIQKMLPMVGNLAYVLLASGFLMTDMLVLRCLLAAGYVTLTCFHVFQVRPLRIPLAGSFFFVLVNSYFGIKIFMERQVSMTDDEKEIFEAHFSKYMLDYEFQTIIRSAKLVEVSEETRLITMGDMHETLFYILDGEVLAFAEKNTVHFGAGEFIAGGSFVLNQVKSTASYDAMPGCRFICWELGKLKPLVEKFPQVRRGLEVKIGHKVARKLREANKRLFRSEHQLLVMRMCLSSKKDTINEALMDVFRKYDVDGDGALQFDDFQAMMNSLVAEPVSPGKLRDLFQAIDKSSSGDIGINEFLQWLKS